MHFAKSTIALFALSAASVNALTIPSAVGMPAEKRDIQSRGVKHISKGGRIVDGVLVPGRAPTSPDSQPLQKKQVATAVVTVLSIVGEAAITELTTQAVQKAIELVKSIKDWNDAREQFTQETTDKMFAANPDPAKFPAAICYNKGYSVKDPKAIDGLASMKFELGPLHTDYDCMYMAGPNQFFTESDGGFINLSAFLYL